MKIIVFFIVLLVISPSSFSAGPGWTSPSKVTRVVVIVNGGINIRLSPDLNGCTSLSGYGARYASIYPDHPGLASMLAILLTAYTSGKDVRLYLSDNTCKVTEIEFG